MTEVAIAAGIRHQSDIADDPDLAVLLDSERFQELRPRANDPSDNDDLQAFDFWVGTRWGLIPKVPSSASGLEESTQNVQAISISP